MHKRDSTPNVPHVATMVPARLAYMSKCVSAKAIPRVSNEAMEPFVATLRSMMPRMQASNVVRRPKAVRALATSSLAMAFFDFLLTPDLDRLRFWKSVRRRMAVMRHTKVMKYAGAVYPFRTNRLGVQ